MPTIVFASSKGGAGKTTAAIVLTSELARQGAAVTLIDADPNQHSAKWALKEGCPANISLVQNSTEESIKVLLRTLNRRKQKQLLSWLT